MESSIAVRIRLLQVVKAEAFSRVFSRLFYLKQNNHI